MKRKQFGQWGEQLAQSYLIRAGYLILATNWRYQRYGEIDIIAYHPETATLAFVEVKSRRNQTYGDPLESMNARKQQTIQKIAEAYLATQTDLPDYQLISLDLIAVIPDSTGLEGGATLRHYPAVI